ncbi:RidA family protein [Acetobacter fabarum]|uniref:RidA family protein n=1 Tax=Acetobacter fabarum TaxID=483199 RepID=UPI00312B6772
MSITRLEPEERLSGAVIHNGLVYLAGQVADDATLDAQGQMEDILRQVDAILAKAGTDKSRLISVQIFLADMGDMAGMNRAWDAWLDKSNKPARATVEAKLADPSWKVELTGVAAQA